ncbi:MAG TPA: cytochrome P450 [Candidatus Limnocylindrales bacterium]|nr:cytochrome P450 [Candidatus Limnocylindrales bacterium]
MLTDQALYGGGNPHDLWASMRRKCPVSWHVAADHDPFWAVTNYEVGMAVLADWRTFTSTNGTFLRPNLSVPYPGAGTMLTLTDPPRHTLLRKVVRGLFDTRAAAALEDRAREIAGCLIDRAIEAGTCDFATDIAARFPLELTAKMLGIADCDVDRMLELTGAAADNILDIDGIEAQQAHLEVLQYYAGVIAARRKCPRHDLVSAFTQAQAGGYDISDEEIILACDNVIVASSETTRHVVSLGLLALIERPALWQSLRRGEVSFATAVEEILRWAPAVNHILRTATQDTELADVQIRAGDPVSVWIPAMNRDDDAFERSGELILGRNPNRHATFGAGRHFCLGAPLARLMIRVLLEELSHRTSEVMLDGPPRRVPSYITAGLYSLPIAVRPN